MLKYIDSKLKRESSEWRQSNWLNHKMQIYRRFPEYYDFKALCYEHIELFRNYAIDIAKGEGNIDEAIRLTKGAIKEEDRYNNNQWYGELRLLYLEKGDQLQARYATKKWYYCNTRDFERYDLWKQMYSEDEQASWDKEVQLLIAHLKKSSGSYYYSETRNLFDLLNREKMTKELIEEVFKKPSLPLLKDYQAYLYPFVPERYLQTYIELIYEYAEKNVNRGAYQELGKYLKYLANMGKADIAKDLRNELLATYKNRRAMKDEFSKISF